MLFYQPGRHVKISESIDVSTNSISVHCLLPLFLAHVTKCIQIHKANEMLINVYWILKIFEIFAKYFIFTGNPEY